MSDAPIFSEAVSLKKLFPDRRFQLPYYQREYTWSRSDLMALLGDLRRRFRTQWSRSADEIEDIKRYAPYFLGSLVYYNEDGRTFLVDGQQRVTTLHLLLIRLQRLLREQDLDDDAGRLVNLIWYERGTFTINIDERADILIALTRGERPAPPVGATPSVRNLYDRAVDLLDDFPPDLLGDELRPFVDWLLNRVCVVVVEASNSSHGWEIFETINHRGAQPSPVDLLKGYLLSQASGRPDELNTVWRTMLARLSGISAQAPGDFVKELIVGKLLDSPTESAIAEATAAFPEWIKANADALGLRKARDFRLFVSEMMAPLADRYASLQYACVQLNVTQEWSAAVAYNHFTDMPHHLAAVLAAVRPSDSDADFYEKARLVESYLDLVFVRRTMNGKADRALSLGPEVWALIPELRECATVEELRKLLAAKVAAIKERFSDKALSTFSLTPGNKAAVRYILARLTSFAETSIRHPNLVGEYLKRGGEFDIEHIWASDSRQQPNVAPQRFRWVRNRLGALLLLRRVDNHELGNDPYRVKVEFYRSQNVLAASLHPAFWQRNKGFAAFVQAHRLERLFRPYPTEFDEAAIEQRQELYRRLCSIVWDPARLGFGPDVRVEPEQDQVVAALDAEAPQVDTTRRTSPSSGTPNTASVARLIRQGALFANEKIQAKRGGETRVARLLADGTVELETGEVLPDIIAAGKAAFGVTTFRGWASWRCERDGALVPLNKIRDAAAGA
jgi:Protein of unknown function DUF262/Restriction Enzyme Adenine Methylase Associated/Protein of unknown function (DUF1524)